MYAYLNVANIPEAGTLIILTNANCAHTKLKQFGTEIGLLVAVKIAGSLKASRLNDVKVNS